MVEYGLSYGHHDASSVVFVDGKVVHAKRYFASDITTSDVADLIHKYGCPDKIYLHENKRRDMLRKLMIGDWRRLVVPKPDLPIKPIYGNHHLSHAAAGYYTSGFDHALVVVADAIGELESLAVYTASNNILNPEPIFVLKYPNSLGLFYSYHTAKVGLIPNRDEGKFMEMGRDSARFDYRPVLDTIVFNDIHFRNSRKLHRYPSKIETDLVTQKWISSTAQRVLDDYFVGLVRHFSVGQKNLVFTGGVAYNTFVRAAIARRCRGIKSIYIPSHPGDAGSSYGAVLQHTHTHITLEQGRMFDGTPQS